LLTSLDVVIPAFVILVLSLSVHEAAHAWMADKLGDPTARQLGRLTLNPMSHVDWIGTVLFPLVAMFTGAPLIGWAKPVPVNWANLRVPRRDFAFVALAGPVSNLLLAAAAAGVFIVVRDTGGLLDDGALPTVALVVWRALTLNVMLAVFNMLPVPPLDGSNVLAGFAPEPVVRGIDALRPHGFILLYALMLTGVLGSITGPIQLALVRWLL
jgi:Zn-dependent protease